ncbi:MAG: HD domain-containing phosphohydrolase [Candidatus Brocadiales bacterium]
MDRMDKARGFLRGLLEGPPSKSKGEPSSKSEEQPSQKMQEKPPSQPWVSIADAMREMSKKPPSESKEQPSPKMQEEPPSQPEVSIADAAQEVPEEPPSKSGEEPHSKEQEKTSPSQPELSFANAMQETLQRLHSMSKEEPPSKMQEEPPSESEEGLPSKMQEEPPSQPEVGVADATQGILKNGPLVIDSEKRGERTATTDIPKELEREKGEVFYLYYNAVEWARGIIYDIKEKNPIDVEDLEWEIFELSDKVLLGGQELFVLSTEAKKTDIDRGELLASHFANVSVIAMTIGAKLGYNKHELMELGVAALFHDIGLFKLKPITDFKGGLDKKAYKHLKKHPKYGAKALKKLGLPKPYIQTALQHHEREDGSGYPSGIKGNKIHKYAKIVGLADIVESLSSNQPSRQGVPVSEAEKTGVENWTGAFDPEIVGALAQMLSALPVGTLAELSSGEVAEVMKEDLTATDLERSWAASDLRG